MSTTSLPRAAVDYPSSDGKPMADNDWQRAAILYALGALQARYAHRPDVTLTMASCVRVNWLSLMRVTLHDGDADCRPCLPEPSQ